MKRILIFIVTLAMLLCMASCQESSTVKCDSCGENNAYDAKYCSGCGASIENDNKASSSNGQSNNRTISKIEIHQEPNKMDYSKNDNIFDSTGLKLKVFYSNGETEIVDSGFTCTPTTLTYYDYVTVKYQGKETELFINFIDDRKELKIPNIEGVSPSEAESILKAADIPYELVYIDEAYLAYDDIPPIPYIRGYGNYRWNEEANYDYIYEDEILEVYVNLPAIYITNVYHEINSVGGVDVNIELVNNSDKTIKYIKFNNVEFYNTVADPAYCSIKDTYKRTLSYTGPLYAGESEYIYWEAVMYNNKTSALVFRTITVEFADGTSQTIEYDAYWYDNRYIGGYPG